MNTQEKIEHLVFEQYGLKKGDPLSIKSQVIKLLEEVEELDEEVEKYVRTKIESRTNDKIRKEAGDVLFVLSTLYVLMDIPKRYIRIESKSESIKFLNKLDGNGLSFFARELFGVRLGFDLGDEEDLLEETTERNLNRTGEIVNGCFVKSEDL